MRWIVALIAVWMLALPVSGSGDSSARRSLCDEPAARATFDSFLRAFNEGDPEALNALFAPDPHFVWYTIAPPQGRAGAGPTGRSSLLAYFAARHEQGEKLGLLSFRYGSAQQRDGAIQSGFHGYLSRRAADLWPSRRGFKAVVRCTPERSELIVVSIGTPVCDMTDVRGRPAPDPARPSFNYGNARIRVALVPADGRLVAGRLHGGGKRATVNADGSIDAKFGWWRAGNGKIRISGRRLDASARPLAADVSDGYPAGFQATTLTFPTTGCWRVTGRYGRTSLTFTMLVLKSPLGP